MNNNMYDPYDLSEVKEKPKKVRKDNLNPKNVNKRNLILSLVLLLVIILFVAVYFLFIRKPEATQTNKDSTKENVVVDKEKDSKEVKIINTSSKTRPYAVMINCHNAALPQAGLQNAYIVYELMVEGGITRMMALFKDRDVDKIGSVRSARTQYLDYVYENDAIYVHAGGAKDALKQIQDEAINDVDVDGVYGVRDKNLKRTYEHTLFTNTNLLKKGVQDKKFRTDMKVESLLTYQADPIDINKFTDKKEAKNISIKYSDYRTSNYSYDGEKQVYLRSMNNTKNIDLVTGEQYQVKNIIVYAVNYSTYTAYNYSGYQKLDNVGKGNGYYITNGYAIPITWEKTSKTSQTVYKYMDGNKLVVNDGNTYIQIYPTSGYLNIQ